MVARRVLFAGVAVAVSAAIWVNRYLAPGPEYLVRARSLSTGPSRVIAGARYWSVLDDRGASIMAEPLGGGPERVVVREPGDCQVSGIQAAGNGSILYTVSPGLRSVMRSARRAPRVVGPASADPMAGRNVGTYRAAPGGTRPAGTGEVRHVIPAPAVSPAIPCRLRSVPLTGGAPRDLVVNVDGKPVVAGDWVYWLRRRWDDRTIVRHGEEWREELRGHSDIACMRVGERVPRVVRRDLSDRTTLASDGVRVSWTEPRPYPNDRVDLASSSGGALPVILAGYDGMVGPVTASGRFYWVAYPARSAWATGGRMAPRAVMSARPDGSDRRIEIDLRDRYPMADLCGVATMGPLQPYAGTVALLLAAGGSDHGGGDRNPPGLLVLPRPGQPRGPVTLCTVPPGARDFALDGRYLYFHLLRPRSITQPGESPEEWWACRLQLAR